jgi:sugar/nucleoside kinase (ribokinase family)
VAGSRLRCDGVWHDVPAYPAREVDPTGAGDVYAAAFLVRYRESGDAPASALFASCVASFSVEAPGLEGIPTLAQVEERMARFLRLRVTRQDG